MKPGLRLVVGGSKDGEFVDWPTDYGFYSIPKMNHNRPKVFYDDELIDQWIHSSISVETYREVKLVLNGTRHFIWVFTEVPYSRIDTPYFLNKIAKLLAPELVGGTWEGRYFSRDNMFVHSYNPFGDGWHVYLNRSNNIKRPKWDWAYWEYIAIDILEAQNEMRFYKVERIPLERVNQTAEIGQGDS